jgi:uncharacterized OsmC-like protein
MYKAQINHKQDYEFGVVSGGSEFNIDVKGKGFSPPDALLVALAGCVGVYIRKYAEGARLKLENFSVTAEAEFSKEPPYCFRNIAVNIDLKGAEIDERRKRALAEFLKNCPVHNTLKANPEIALSII